MESRRILAAVATLGLVVHMVVPWVLVLLAALRRSGTQVLSTAPSDAIVVLLPTRASVIDELRVMAASLRRLDDSGRTRVLLLHEQGMPTALRNELRAAVHSGSGRVVDTAPVDFAALSAPYPPRWYANASKHGGGYRTMCDLFAHAIFDHPALRETRFVLRLDTDSQLLGRWPDLFTLMASRPKAAYLANPMRARFPDCGDVVRGLARLADRFAKARRLAVHEPFTVPPPAWLPEDKRRHMTKRFGRNEACVQAFYTNFELLRLDAFRGSRVFRDWAAEVRRDGGVFRYRWGDAPLRRVSLSLMAGSDGWQTLWLNEVAPQAGYCHGRTKSQSGKVKRPECIGSVERTTPNR